MNISHSHSYLYNYCGCIMYTILIVCCVFYDTIIEYRNKNKYVLIISLFFSLKYFKIGLNFNIKIVYFAKLGYFMK